MLRTTAGSLLLLAATAVWAADVPASGTIPGTSQAAPAGTVWIAILENGFSMQHYSRDVVESGTRLFLSRDRSSFVDVPSESIVEIQAERQAAPPVLSKASSVAEKVQPAKSLEDLVTAASDRHGIDAALIRSVIAAESGFNPGAVSPKGAQGLMQLMPATASSLGVEDAFNPEHNVEGGTRYLRELLLLYKGDLVKALAAYNAGPERVDQYNGVPPYRETRAYVSRVIHEFNRQKLQQQRTRKVTGSD